MTTTASMLPSQLCWIMINYFYAPAGMGDMSGALPLPPTGPPLPRAIRLFEDSHTSSASAAEPAIWIYLSPRQREMRPLAPGSGCSWRSR